MLELWRVLRRERPDIVHTHGWGTLCEGLLAARMARVPFVIHGEHGTLQLKPNQVRTQRWAWQRTNQLLSVSSRLAERTAPSSREAARSTAPGETTRCLVATDAHGDLHPAYSGGNS